MCVSFLNTPGPFGPGLWRCRGWGLLGPGYLCSLPPTFLPSCFCISAKFLHCSCHRRRRGQSSCSELDHWRFVFLTFPDTQVSFCPSSGWSGVPARHSISLSSQDESPTASVFLMGKYRKYWLLCSHFIFHPSVKRCLWSLVLKRVRHYVSN